MLPIDINQKRILSRLPLYEREMVPDAGRKVFPQERERIEAEMSFSKQLRFDFELRFLLSILD